jgi:methylmalonyl-CoA mutase
VMDPAAGSGGLEDLTDKLCRTAWMLFQEIEQAGGAWAALEQGLIQGKVAAVRAEREQAIARRRDALTGTSDFPDLAEAPVAVLDVPPVAAPPYPAALKFDALPSVRLAEPFEKLRDASDRMLAKSGARPKIFLANLGKPTDFTARASFAKNFFEAGGIEAVTSDGFAGRREMIAAFKSSGARLACLCSSDDVYAREAEDAAKTLAAAGARVYLAGRPGEREQALRAAGIEGFVFAGCDVLAALQAAHALIAS